MFYHESQLVHRNVQFQRPGEVLFQFNFRTNNLGFSFAPIIFRYVNSKPIDFVSGDCRAVFVSAFVFLKLFATSVLRSGTAQTVSCMCNVQSEQCPIVLSDHLQISSSKQINDSQCNCQLEVES